MSLRAAALSRRGCTSMSRISPSLSTARHSHRRVPPITTAISSRCHCVLGLGRSRRRLRAKAGPNFRTQRRTVSYDTSSPALGEEFLHVAVAQGEPEIEPDRVPDDLGWELMSGVGDGLHAPILLPLSAIRVTMPQVA